MRNELPQLLARNGGEVVREHGDGDGDEEVVRLVYGCHALPEGGSFRRLSLHPRLLGPVQQLLREDVYIHQTRLNPKQGFGGGSWSWHQDFGTWNLVDGLAEPRAVMAAVFLDEATAANAPLLIVPGSQNHGLIDTASRDTEQGYVIRKVDRQTLSRLVDEGGLEALTGPAGSVALLHCNSKSPFILHTPPSYGLPPPLPAPSA